MSEAQGQGKQSLVEMLKAMVRPGPRTSTCRPGPRPPSG